MVLFNYATRELTAKIVYYGPGLCGKTTNLEYIHKSLPEKTRGKMLSLATQTDRTLFFDFLPLDLGSIKGMKTRIQLYTVPGQVFYDATRKLVLKGADGVVFVVDSQKEMLESNLESWDNLKQNLKENGLDIETIPLVIQYNKRDLPNVLPIRTLHQRINSLNAPHFEAVALTGKGVQETLKGITKLVLESLSQKYGSKEIREEEPESIETEAPKPVSVPAVEQEEEIRELPVPVEMRGSEDSEISLEPLPETYEDLEELEEIQEAHAQEVHAQEGKVAQGKEEEEVETLEPDVPEEIQPVKSAPSEPSPVDVSPPPSPRSVEVTAPVSVIASVQSNAASSQNVSVPVEIWVGKGEQEIRLQISISLKIHLTS